MRHLLRTADLDPTELRELLDLSAAFRANPDLRPRALAGRTVVLYFTKPSTRTRLSTCAAVARLGGQAVIVGPAELQLGRGETIADTARVISRFASALVVRTFADADVQELAAHASIPIVNALTDGHHPLQSLADLMTLEQHCGPVDTLRVAWIGDGNNVAHSLMEAVALAGGTLMVGVPEGYGPDPAVLADARAIAARTGATIEVVHDPVEAVEGAHAVVTDVWLSMGDPDDQKARRLRDLAPFQVNADLLAHAREDVRFLHCLPAHRGEEVTAEVIDGPRSVVFDQAENRLHTVAAVLATLTSR
ncbi:MAG: ornithine carbamoyltransferase [Myxococcales bacterium]|nr:ornithine carbamoyltransferase [Myxococcales bacterium]